MMMILLRILAFKLLNSRMNDNFKMDKREILQRISRGLQWENKPPKLKKSIGVSVPKTVTAMEHFSQEMEAF